MTAKDRFDSHDRCGEEEIILSSLAFHRLQCASRTIDSMTAKDRFDSHDRCGEEEIILSSLAFHSNCGTNHLPYQLENLLRQVDCRITMPYWDWSLESQTWQNSIIWNAQCGFGGNGDRRTNGQRVTTGPFQWQTWTQPDGNSLSRSFNNVLPDCAAVAMAQRMGVSQFRTWHDQIQNNFHNSVHCNIGGTMCTAASANDPIFFLHHGFIDKIWSDWQGNGAAYKNLAFYSMNTSPMPGASGALLIHYIETFVKKTDAQ